MNVVLGLPITTESNSIRVPGDDIRLWHASNVVITYIPAPRIHDRFTDYELYDVDNWDGYGALPISRETVESARRFFLQIPRRFDYVDIAPGSDGTIGFEWRFGSGLNLLFVLIDVGPGDIVTARKIYPSGKITPFSSTRVGIGADSLISQLFQYPFL